MLKFLWTPNLQTSLWLRDASHSSTGISQALIESGLGSQVQRLASRQCSDGRKTALRVGNRVLRRLHLLRVPRLGRRNHDCGLAR